MVRSRDLGYRALALTDHDNLCGALHFGQVARSLDVPAITGAGGTPQDRPPLPSVHPSYAALRPAST